MTFLRGDGIIISKRDVEEADRYITVFMEDFGKISTIIKGIRKSKRRDKTAVDLLSLTNFSFYRKGENIIISDFHSVESYEGIKADIEKINIALYLFSMFNQILVENGKNRKLYELLKKSLNTLNRENDSRKMLLLVAYFLFEVIKNEGLIPETEDVKIFFIDNHTDTATQKELEILKNLLDNSIRKVIESEKYRLENIKKVIIILEKYLNFNLETKLNATRFLWGDLLW